LEAVTRIVRRATLAAASVVVLGTLAGCGTGFNAQTNLVEGPQGTQAEVGAVLIRNALLVADEDDGSLAALVVGLINQGDSTDALTEVKVGDSTAPTESTLPAGGLELPPGELVGVGSESGPSVTLRTTEGAVVVGDVVQLTLNFRDAGPIEISVPVHGRAGAYATVSVSPFPMETATPVPTGAAGTPQSPGANPSPTASPATP
jgi:copper(I)-binding protein